MKEYNIRRHYETNHAPIYSNYTGKLREDKVESLKRTLQIQQGLIKKNFENNENVTRAGYEITKIISQHGKPFSDGMYIKNCIIEAVNCLCPLNSSLFDGISLSASSVSRRTEELGKNIYLQICEKTSNMLWYSLALDESVDISGTSQLLIFIRGVDENISITEELASVCSIHGTTTGKDIFDELEQTISDYNLEWEKLSCVTIDGAKNMAGSKKGLVGQITNKLEELHISNTLFIHCILQQHALCAKALNISCVLNPVISCVLNPLNHRQFKVLLDDFGSEYFDLPYYTAVRWLSCGNVLNRFYKLRSEIDIFLTSKNNYYPELSDLAWLSKLSFLVDVTTHMNELNLKLQEKENLICDFYRIIKAFRQKLMLFGSQLGVRQFSHFSCFKSFCEANCNEIDITFQIGIIKELKHHFLHKFSELDKIESDIILFENPFSCNVENVQHELQLEVIDLQSNEQLKDCHRRTKLAEFYEYLKDDEFPRLKNFAIKMISIFGTTYQCEQTFSRMKYVKSAHRARLTDGHLKSILMIGCSSI
ncbi:general transcription factor II-I repeat domain-containing protein 2-like [Octopus sinensis]|uniref:General transcription factor II-I repeat domain-containing protein 2-like n=1 Tax=Octopus sinensis TaxID=2607531 RepID=A0A6P7TPL4_9MOLL|nr:general transcription factor II-I repeat domain-containing protein 2-like [Octopus sinensis]